jgi:hypothetical protein
MRPAGRVAELGSLGFNMKPLLRPLFSGQTEIRMGSPFRIAHMRLEGDWVPDLPEGAWQDLYAHSDNGKMTALIRWDIPNNEPGFRLVIIDVQHKTVDESERIPGCCESLEWRGGGFAYRSFGFRKPNQTVQRTGASRLVQGRMRMPSAAGSGR